MLVRALCFWFLGVSLLVTIQGCDGIAGKNEDHDTKGAAEKRHEVATKTKHGNEDSKGTRDENEKKHEKKRGHGESAALETDLLTGAQLATQPSTQTGTVQGAQPTANYGNHDLSSLKLDVRELEVEIQEVKASEQQAKSQNSYFDDQETRVKWSKEEIASLERRLKAKKEELAKAEKEQKLDDASEKKAEKEEEDKEKKGKERNEEKGKKEESKREDKKDDDDKKRDKKDEKDSKEEKSSHKHHKKDDDDKKRDKKDEKDSKEEKSSHKHHSSTTDYADLAETSGTHQLALVASENPLRTATMAGIVCLLTVCVIVAVIVLVDIAFRRRSVRVDQRPLLCEEKSSKSLGGILSVLPRISLHQGLPAEKVNSNP